MVEPARSLGRFCFTIDAKKSEKSIEEVEHFEQRIQTKINSQGEAAIVITKNIEIIEKVADPATRGMQTNLARTKTSSQEVIGMG